VANVDRRAGLDDSAIRAKRGLKERLEVGVGHAVALNFQLLFGVALVIDVIRRVCPHQIRHVACHEVRDLLRLSRVTDQQAMLIESPAVVRP
jgi:hypothetical protein